MAKKGSIFGSFLKPLPDFPAPPLKKLRKTTMGRPPKIPFLAKNDIKLYHFPNLAKNDSDFWPFLEPFFQPPKMAKKPLRERPILSFLTIFKNEPKNGHFWPFLTKTFKLQRQKMTKLVIFDPDQFP